jgi:hypothetical protein
VAAGGGKWWRLRYHFDGKEKRRSLGVYPEVGLKAPKQLLPMSASDLRSVIRLTQCARKGLD